MCAWFINYRQRAKVLDSSHIEGEREREGARGNKSTQLKPQVQVAFCDFQGHFEMVCGSLGYGAYVCGMCVWCVWHMHLAFDMPHEGCPRKLWEERC